MNIPRLTIAAPGSGSGKSTIACGLMATFSRQFGVQGFKVGPDYIDPMYHSLASQRASHNLDSWMCSQDAVKEIFVRNCSTAQLAILEGVMGLYDGYSGDSEDGSTAQVAKLLSSPVILVIDVQRMGRSAAAIALGYKNYDPHVDIGGVICNRVGSDKHAEMVRKAIEALGIPVLGCIPRTDRLNIPERHLGLYTAVERREEAHAFIHTLAESMQQWVDFERLLQIAKRAPDLNFTFPHQTQRVQTTAVPVRIAVARDEAFCFYYEDNFHLLRESGAEIVFFSPLHDLDLPPDIAGIYLGGGYPEIYAKPISQSQGFMQALHKADQDKMPIYAECGGLMVLTQGIVDFDERLYPMAGLLPGITHMGKRLTLGYRVVKAQQNTLFLAQGEETRGHEFHYSSWQVDLPQTESAYQITNLAHNEVRFEGLAQDHLLASYVHLHFRANANVAWRFVEACRRWKSLTK